MKKVFLVFGVAAFSSAAAQQNDLFDIQQHLQKKQSEFKRFDENSVLSLPRLNSYQTYAPYTTNKPDQTYTLPNGDKLIVLGQDNMPCVVPDMSQFGNMPNAGLSLPYASLLPFYRQPGQIPNGTLPFRMIVPVK